MTPPAPRSHGGRALVVGSGPNGLAGAIVLAEAGLDVTVAEEHDTPGGGLRSAELLVPGVVHDLCSAVHPLAQASPFYRGRAADLKKHGLQFLAPEVDACHPLPDQNPGVLLTGVGETARGLGDARDRRAWQLALGPLAERADELAGEFLRPPLHLPRRPLLAARFGALAGMPAAALARALRSPAAKALAAGILAHSFAPHHLPASAAPGLLLAAAGHRHGWPVARGGSGAIATALIGLLDELGGRVETGRPIDDAGELSGFEVVLLDTSLERAAAILRELLPARVAGVWRRFRRGPAVAKIDAVIEGEIPWLEPQARRAGTVHLGGEAREVARAERDCWADRLPEQPFTLVAQQHLADPSRSTTDTTGRRLNPVWAYSHVPAGWEATEEEAWELVSAQIERAAPGFKERVVAHRALPPRAIEAHNANNLGGDIAGGANGPIQLLARPRLLGDPYFTGVPGVFVCSASTPPGGGVHFMAGENAARSALRWLERR
ncbi:phytoene desaturase family protein [Corynebacterium otitidis]